MLVRKGDPMRIVNLPNIRTQLSSADECARIYLERLGGDDAPWPHVSLLLIAYIAWPNNEDRRDSFVASWLARLAGLSEKRANEPVLASPADVTFEMFGGLNAIANAALDQLLGEIGQVQRRWLLVADKLGLTLNDPSIGGLLAVKCLRLAMDDRAAFFDDNLGDKGLGAVFASTSYYRAHDVVPILLFVVLVVPL